MSLLPKTIYRLKAIPIKICVTFSTELEKNPKIYMELQKTPNKQSNPEKKNTARAITLSHFKTYYTATVIQTAECWHKTRYIDQWNKNDSPEINPHIYGQLIYNKGARNIQWKMKSLSDKFWEN